MATAVRAAQPARPKRPRVHPVTLRELRPGQRIPSAREVTESGRDLTTSRIGRFPNAGAWGITPKHAEQWYCHNFEGRRGDTNAFRSTGDLSEPEFAQLLWDISLWEGMVRRWEAACVAFGDALARWAAEECWWQWGPQHTETRPEMPTPPVRPLPLHEYLAAGREDWGDLQERIGRMLATRPVVADPDRPGRLIDLRTVPALVEAGGLHDVRDRAIVALDRDGLAPTDIVKLDCGHADFDWERESFKVRVGDRWQRVSESTAYAVECYLDMLPGVPEDQPLVMGRDGSRLSVRQVRRIVGRLERLTSDTVPLSMVRNEAGTGDSVPETAPREMRTTASVGGGR